MAAILSPGNHRAPVFKPFLSSGRDLFLAIRHYDKVSQKVPELLLGLFGHLDSLHAIEFKLYLHVHRFTSPALLFFIISLTCHPIDINLPTQKAPHTESPPFMLYSFSILFTGSVGRRRLHWVHMNKRRNHGA